MIIILSKISDILLRAMLGLFADSHYVRSTLKISITSVVITVITKANGINLNGFLLS